MQLFITFGQIHAHRVNNITFDCNKVAVIECDDYAHGRKRAFELFGDKFFTSYLKDEIDMKYFPEGAYDVDTRAQVFA